MNSLGRNIPNKNIEKTFSGDNLYHKKKINDAIDIYNNPINNENNNKNNNIPSGHSSIGHKNKSTFLNMAAGRGGNCGSTSPQNKEKLIRISEFKMEGVGQNTNENKYSLNNSKDLINRLKNQALSLKSSITNKNNVNNNINNINKNKVINCFQFDDKENLSINKHIQNELSHCHLVKGINILNKDETFEIEHKKHINDKNKFNKNSCFFNNEKNKIKSNTNSIDKKEKEIIKKDKEENITNKEEVNTIIQEKEHTNNMHKNKNNTIEKEKEKEKENNLEQENKEIKNSIIKTPTKKDTNKYKPEEPQKEDEEEKVIYFDISNINNVQIPKDYLNIIYYNLLQEENIELNPKPIYTYMKNQKEINDQMRSILVDWIIDVHHKFGFTDETLFMTILIIDRYCSIEQVTRIKYQCLGITALMIACKHEEINVPKVEDFIYITDNAYTKEEVFKMENDVLSKLNFSLLYPSPIKFYEYLSLHFNFIKKYHMLGKYLMESFLLDLKYIKYKPSIISCACTYIVMKFFKMSNYRQSYEKKFYLVDENINTIGNGFGVKDCAQDICVFVDNINNTNLLSCQKKYSKTEFESVSTLISNNKS